MSLPPIVAPTTDGASDMLMEGYYLIVLQVSALNDCPTLVLRGPRAMARTIRLPRPVAGVIAGQGGGGVLVVTQEAALVTPQTSAPPSATMLSGRVEDSTGTGATWVMVWAEEGSHVESNAFISSVSWVGPVPMWFGPCVDPYQYSGSNV